MRNSGAAPAICVAASTPAGSEEGDSETEESMIYNIPPTLPGFHDI